MLTYDCWNVSQNGLRMEHAELKLKHGRLTKTAEEHRETMRMVRKTVDLCAKNVIHSSHLAMDALAFGKQVLTVVVVVVVVMVVVVMVVVVMVVVVGWWWWWWWLVLLLLLLL